MSGATADDASATRGGGGADGDVAGYHVMLAAVLYKKALLLARYPVNTGAQVLSIYLFFAVIFFGGKTAAESMGGGMALTPTLEGLIVGWFLWTMSIIAYFSLSNDITREASWGTLEQLYMSPYGFGSVMASMVVANLLESLLWGGTILALMLATTSQSLSLPALTILVVSVLTLMSVVGIGFVFAGLALLYKRIENVSQLMQFVLIGLIAAPAAGISPLRVLPLVQGSAMLQLAMREGVRLWAFPTADLAVLVGTAAAYSLAGYGVFMLLARRARREGVLGHY
jgi:ABC-2 type transport system permease protein